MFQLARHLTNYGPAATLAGIAYAFNGLMLNSLMWPNNIAAFGLAPGDSGVRSGEIKGYSGSCIAALAGGAQMLTGAPEHPLTWMPPRWLGVSGVPRCQRFDCSPHAFWRGGGTDSVAGVGATSSIPDMLGHSHRTTDFGTGGWSMPLVDSWVFRAAGRSHANPQGVFMQNEQVDLLIIQESRFSCCTGLFFETAEALLCVGDHDSLKRLAGSRRSGAMYSF